MPEKKFKHLAEQLEYELTQAIKGNKEKLFAVNNNNKTCYLTILKYQECTLLYMKAR